jgi:hypothetical protein
MSKVVDNDDTQPLSVTGQGLADTDPHVAAQIASADTAEWDDTDREVPAQGPSSSTPQMFEDTGVVIIDKPTEIQRSDRFAVTFKKQRVTFEEEAPTEPVDVDIDVEVTHQRQATVGDWPPTPREPATRAPQIRDRAFKRAGVYHVVGRPDTKNEKN